MKTITLAILACGAASLISEAALATTSWQMQHKYGGADITHTRVFDRANPSAKIDVEKIRVSLIELLVGHGQRHSFSPEKYAKEHFLKDSFWSQEPHQGWDKHAYNWDKRAKWGKDRREWIWKEHQHHHGCGHHDDVSEVPIPASVWLFVSALGFLGWTRRRKAIA